MNLQENISRIKEMMGLITEGLHDTSWENVEGDKITLIDLLNATEDIPVQETIEPEPPVQEPEQPQIQPVKNSVRIIDRIW